MNLPMTHPQPPTHLNANAGASSIQAPANAYLRTRVMTASPAELRLLLLDGAVKFARQAREGIAAKDYEASYTGVTSCRNIVVELMTSIRAEVDPTLAEKVRALYMFIFTELTNANMDHDLPKFDKVIELLEFERETWALLMAKVKSEQVTAPSGAALSA
jgi:flagellar protein FliS